jgi:hypothetical protein
MRFRIAAAAAVALIVVPSFLFGLSHGAPSARPSAAPAHPWDVKMKLMSYDQAVKYVAYTNAVQANEVRQFLKMGQFLTAVVKSENTIPASWMATAICEEGGRNDPTSGYFGIKEWNGFDGYRTAGSAPLSVQLAWEARYIGGPPDAPGQCHSY